MWWSKEAMAHGTYSCSGDFIEQCRVYRGTQYVSQTMIANSPDIPSMTLTDPVDRRVCHVLANDPQSGQKRKRLSFAA